MMHPRYADKVKEVIKKFDPQGSNRYFLFGSSTRKEKFGDVDIGVEGNSRSEKNLSNLREQFEESTIPYFVDVIDFDSASSKFTDYVRAKENIVWLD